MQLMRAFLFSLFILFLVLSREAISTEIYIHTDNLGDYNSMLKQESSSISSSTFILALSNLDNKLIFQLVTGQRTQQFMKANDNVCAINKIKTPERSKKYIFSQPVNLYFSRRLYQLNAFPPIFGDEENNQKSVSLIDLFNNRPNSHLLISNQISYGEELDKLLATIPNENKLVRQGIDHDYGMISMFSKGRSEFALLYPQDVFDYPTNIKSRSYEIASIPPFVTGRLMCSKNEKMEKFIDKVNRQLRKVIESNALFEAHLPFVSKQELAVFTNYFDTGVRKAK